MITPVRVSFIEMEVAFPSQKKTLQKNELVAAALREKQRNINCSKIEHPSGFISRWTIKATQLMLKMILKVYYCCDPKLIRITKKFQKFRPNSLFKTDTELGKHLQQQQQSS
jgi:hypothetical protein